MPAAERAAAMGKKGGIDADFGSIISGPKGPGHGLAKAADGHASPHEERREEQVGE